MNDALLHIAGRHAATEALTAGALLLLAALRWFGFFWVAPLPGRSSVPLRARFALAMLLAVVVLPVLIGPGSVAESDGLEQFGAALSPIAGQLTGSPGSEQPLLAPALLQLGLLAGSEFVLGLVLAFGMRIVLSGIQLAGELIDQQAGIALAEVFNPAMEQETTPTGDWLVWTAIAVFLAAPFQGDLRTAALMLDLFHALPVATASGLAPAQGLVMAVVQQSLVLSLQLALPLLAVMFLISLATGWASRAGRPLVLWPGMLPLRIGVCLLLIAVGAAGSAELLLAWFAGWIDGARALLTG
jgi:flagellar biosynthesis protein FliR